MPNMIKHQGEIYVEAGTSLGPVPKWYKKNNPKHKKCAKGTHWNVKSKKCEKLPPGLRSLRSKASTASKIANDATKKRPPLHTKAYKAHAEAGYALNKAGFKGLADKHRALVHHHIDKAIEFHRGR